MIFIAIAVLFISGLLLPFSVAQENEQNNKPFCNGKYKGKKPTTEELKKVLADHRKWIEAGKKESDERRANLCGANLEGANLRKAELSDANISGAYLVQANLSEALLINANLSEANLWKANLSRTILANANLVKAFLHEANTKKTVLSGAHLSEAQLWKTDLSEAELDYADLKYVLFDLKSGTLPEFNTIVFSKNLHLMQYDESPRSLLELREAFKKAGLRQQEREITYAIEHTKRQHLMWGHEKLVENTFKNFIEGLFIFIFFELTCGYGLYSGRPLWIMFFLIFVFAVPYFIVLTKKQKRAGIWEIWPQDRVIKNEGSKKPLRLQARGLRTIRIAIYFSLLSAFHLGWRDLNVGTWISRIQAHEYTLRATGWARTVSGIQSLISIYMLALAVLTYFGRPFEG